MGENEAVEVQTQTAPIPTVIDKSALSTGNKKEKKKDKKPIAKAELIPHITGRLMQVEVGPSGVAFTIKGKKDKAEVFTLKGMDSSNVSAAAALLAGLLDSKNKLRVEYAIAADNSRTVKKLRAHN